MARPPGEAPIERDEVEDRDKYLGINKRKRGGKLKRLPFHSKATGSAARHRPDRRARGGGVSTIDRLPLNVPPAGETGAVKQKFKAGGHITTAQRKALPSSDFALPGKGKGAGGKGPGSYPIDTPNRARNALARGAQHASPAERATIERKVHAKYPGIGES
jgi:hypothetical protein